MRHRQMLNATQIPEADGDQGWNLTGQPYLPMARAGAFESSSLVHPVENMAIQGGPFFSSAPMSSRDSSSILNPGATPYQPKAPGPSHDPFPHQPDDANFYMAPHNYLHSSSTLIGQTAPRVDEGQTMVRGSHKRKSPCVPQLLSFDAGSSSNLHLPPVPWQENQNTESYKYPPGYRVNNISISGESMPRNVRSRTGAAPEPSPVRTNSSSNFSHHPFSGRSFDQTNSVGFPNSLVSPAGHGMTIGSGSGSFSHYPNTLDALNNYNATSNTVPQNANCVANQFIRGTRSNYDQRSAPAFRASSSNFQAGPQVAAAPDERLQMAAAENYPSIHRRVVSAIRLRNSERNGGTGMLPSDIIRSLTEQGLMAMYQSAFRGSRNPTDQHMNMRLDVDSMSYEELILLGERIGSVSTGLSDNLISKCLTESIYCSSDQIEDEERCVICLEEYKHMVDVGNLKCGHDFHVGCIRKWLSMKNLCPICKSPAIDECNKET
ncbi:probable E3 ubiquitin-protein ligase hip1 [Phtheirospermum japonicum]|uniref:RING-type E3 ubiquitin transferase n=1 Tax=Phtheirospermum japonicum TaxID=374723 RepID=A0A830BNH2_9LAMI|nr:probable E3 ubiquitin-protein ligase hip1 [Phtheirospermum japonicum]